MPANNEDQLFGDELPATPAQRHGQIRAGWEHLPMPVDWYRTPDYDQAARTEFTLRYNRARHPHRVQYKIIKAIHLMEAGDPRAIDWAAQLLTEVTRDDHAYRHDKGHAFEALAELHRRTGQWELAVRSLEQCIKITSPTMSGTSGLPDLTLAEILLENDPSGVPKVASLLSSQPLIDRIKFNSQLFRYLVATARTRQRLGEDPAPPAQRALDLLENDQPRFPRHPTVGRIHADEQTIHELRDLAGR